MVGYKQKIVFLATTCMTVSAANYIFYCPIIPSLNLVLKDIKQRQRF